MDAVIDAPRGHEPESAKRVRAFRATDQFALAAWQAARSFARADGESLAREVRRALARAGGALVAAATGSLADAPVRRALESAHAGLLEVRYYLYLARRLGCLDLKAYRQLTALQDIALRELGSVLEDKAAGSARIPG
jgi:four helix bundle protein